MHTACTPFLAVHQGARQRRTITRKTTCSHNYNFTSTTAFQSCSIQREALAFCEYIRVSPVHIHFDSAVRALFIDTSDDKHCVVDLRDNIMSCTQPSNRTVKALYRDIARTKCVRTANHLFYGIVHELGLSTHGRGSLEFSRSDHARELVVAMRFELHPLACDVPMATHVVVHKDHTHTEHELFDDLTRTMGIKAITPPRPSRWADAEPHDW